MLLWARCCATCVAILLQRKFQEDTLAEVYRSGVVNLQKREKVSLAFVIGSK